MSILAEHTGQPLGRASSQDTERDHFMTAEEALDYGLVDEIIAPRRDAIRFLSKGKA